MFCVFVSKYSCIRFIYRFFSLRYQLNLPPECIVSPDRFKIPYNCQGKLTENQDEWIVWDLSRDSKHKVVSGPGQGFRGMYTFFFQN